MKKTALHAHAYAYIYNNIIVRRTIPNVPVRRRGHFLFPYFAKNLRLCKVTVCKWLLKEKPRFFSPICRICFYFFNSATIYVRKVDNNKKTVGMPLSPIKVLEIVVCCLAFSGFKEPHLHPSLPLLHLITCFFQRPSPTQINPSIHSLSFNNSLNKIKTQ